MRLALGQIAGGTSLIKLSAGTLVVQTPTYRVNSTQDLGVMPVTAPGKSNQILSNIAAFGRKNVPLVASQLNIRPVFDANADVS